MKLADTVSAHVFDTPVGKDGDVIKAVINPDAINMDSFNATLAINTTNIMDSHMDVHFPGIWNKSIKEIKPGSLYLLKEHNMTFENIISDEVTPMVKTMTWEKLGFDYPGSTQVLLFNANIKKKRNPYMAEQYAMGYVKNHSVGMRYINFELAMNSDSKYDKTEREVWDKYISQVVNKEVAEEYGFFWAVLEAKVIEGSAVPMGSNFATPTISVGKIEPSKDTHQEPEKSTPSFIQKMSEYISNNLNH